MPVTVLWAKVLNGKRMEVRGAGRTRRLYVDGVLHTQYNPNMILTGSVWDPIALSAFFSSPHILERVLVLGVGGGAAIQLLRRYIKPKKIVAVEIDGTHLRLAKQYFGLTGSDLKLVKADAVQWISDYRGPKFQLVIDDLWGESDGEPVRAIKPHRQWVNKLLRVCDDPGWLTLNLIGRSELEESYLLKSDRMERRFPSVYRFSMPQLENSVSVFCGIRASHQNFWRSVRACAPLDSAAARKLMRFRLHRVR